jgi:hypothetical protein
MTGKVVRSSRLVPAWPGRFGQGDVLLVVMTSVDCD